MRVLVAIGCDHYSSEKLSDLAGAENDASAIFDLLARNEGGFYDKDRSILLRSPSSEEARAALEQTIFDTNNDEVDFCLFFAGHGYLKDGAYFLCVKDTSVDRLSVSAIGITELFMWINEANVRDSNIVIDSCQAGGIACDVAAFLKPGKIGNLGSPSISVLAAAAADQVAREINGQGVATSALLKCLSGEVVVQTDRPSLNLIEVGHSVAELMGKENQQAPVYWGLNLFGRSLFASNPRFDEPKRPVIGLPDGLNRSADDEPVIREHATKVWELYLSSSRQFDAISFLNLTQSLLSDLPTDSTAAPIIVDALATTFRQIVSGSNDPFEEIELLGACIASLLRYSDGDDVAASVIIAMSNQLLETISSGSKVVLNAIEENHFALLSERSALADLYYLPIRILKILGWVGTGQYIANMLNKECPKELLVRQQLVRAILEIYTCSIVAVSDEQTCNFVIFLCVAESMELSDEAEQLFGLLCHTFHKFDGNISRAHLSGSNAYKFIKARAEERNAIHEGLISRPTEFLSALMCASEKLALSGVVDSLIEDFDHMSANLFVPDSYTSFAEERIDNGLNHTFIIGHGVWCVKDFMDTWRTVRAQIDSDPSIELPAIQIAAICAALIKPNRTPWFVWD
ncbi:MAG: caspase family protein [Porticoccaceae bacterium]|nr:caspase family protein [Porticoccaceae bacterium]